ncbi:VCBS domain-containing protein [Halomonas sp. DN3]|uniref:Ig-like domain-containing protein n=1 Tax=Halomonas sp. DN3 TaxID=2953657 RepID=UPI00209EA7A6|nr:VCBS domain-containing protein [Halomonas sp. DN3]USZ51647.1 VCBS domain-containing protein [Halomonas sp. DN3]
MPVTIAIVSSLQGNAWVKRPNGDVIALEEGDRLEVGDIVITADGTLVTLQFADGRPGVTLVDAQQVSLPEDMGQGDANSVDFLSREEVSELLELIAEGNTDILEAIEEPTAGDVAGGGNDGFDFVRLMRIAEVSGSQFYSFGDPLQIGPSERGEVGGTPLEELEEEVDAGSPSIEFEDSDGEASAGVNGAVEGGEETVTGSFTVSAPSGVASIGVAGREIASAASEFPLVLEGEHGTLTITGFDPETGIATYDYTENGLAADHTAGDGSVFDRFDIVVTDAAGGTVTESLAINILDTEPEAEDDTAALGEDADTAISGDVLTNDTAGADPMSFDSFSDADTARYGTFTDNGDGTWSYRVDADNAEVQALTQGETLTETFSYTVSDDEGDTSTATLTITITGNDDDVPTIEIPDGNEPENSQPGDPESVAGDHSVVEGSGATTPVSTMTVAAEAGITSVTLTDKDGKAENIMGAQEGDDSTHVTIVGDHGSVTVTNFDAASGEITYNYTENGLRADHSGSDPVLDSFALTVTDNEGDSSSAALEVNVLDTVPLAEDDAARVGEDSGSPVIGNVLENDLSRADGLRFEGFNDTSAKYGTFTDNGDGTWSYSVNTVNAAVQALDDGEHLVETFSYTVKDTDGDVSTATLTVLIDGSTDGDPNVVIQDSDGDLSVGDNSVVEGSGETVSGAMLLTATAGIATATIAGSDITGATSDNPVVIETDQGKLEITGFDSGVVEYRYTDNSQRADHDAGDGSVVDRFEVVVTDTAGESNSDSLDISILDTEPEAEDDTAALGEDADTAISGDVLTNDTAGADPMSFDSFSDADTARYGTFTDNGDGTWSYRVDADNAEVQALTQGETLTETFSYTVSDNDGDSSTATLTITITGNDDDVPTIEIPDGNGPDGSDPDDPASVAGDHSVVEASGDKTPVSTMTVAADAGITSVTLTDKDGKAENIMGAQEGDDSTHVTIVGDHGSVTVTDYDAASGKITYFYTENGLRADHSGSDPVLDSFALTVTDNEGDSSSAALEINILDTVPLAEDDAARVGEDSGSPVIGNVLENDQSRPDGLRFEGFNDTSAKYGTFTDNGDGTWSYSVNTVNAAVQALDDGEHLVETFSYTVKDADGDVSTATLTVLIDGSTDGDPNVVIQDSDGDLSVGDNSVVEGSGETVSGAMLLSATAGIATATIAGSNITGATSDNPVVIETDQGMLEITGFDSGVVEYRYTENSQRADHDAGDGSVVDRFEVVVTDIAGESNSDSLDINILDTEPEAKADTAALGEDADTAISGNVLTNDTAGADPMSFDSFSDDDTAKYGTFTDNGDGTWSYSVDADNAEVQALTQGETLTETFSYTVSDDDGDTSTTTLTITINGVDDDVPTIEIPDGNGPDGSDPDDPTSVAGDHSVVEASGDRTPVSTMTVAADAGITGVTLTDKDGVAKDITEADSASGKTVTVNGVHGSVTVTDYDAATGEITYSYTENGQRADHSGSDPVLDSFALTVTDNEGDSSSAALEVNILDTEPQAEDDTAALGEDADTASSGNVLTNDTAGADPMSFDSFSDDDTAKYGTFTDNGDGTWSYSVDADNAEVQALKQGEKLTETFSYTVSDDEGDTSSATLTITINGVDDDVPTIEIPDGNGPDGSDPDDPASVAGDHSLVEASGDKTPVSTMTVEADAGITSVTLTDKDGKAENIMGAQEGDDSTHVTIVGDHGSMTVTDYDAASGEITYFYTENGLRADHSGSDPVLDSFALTVSDNEGDSSSADLEINILDTAPVAEDDANVIEENATSVSANVIDGVGDPAVGADIQGEDKPDVTTISSDNVSGSSASVPATGEVSIQGQYGTLTIAADGSYSYSLDNTNATVQALKGDSAALNEVFSYTLKDLDDDTSSATLTITINGVDDDVPTIEIPDGNGPDGSDPDDPASVAGDHSVVEASGDKTPVSTMTVAADAGITSVTLTDKDGKAENIMGAQEGNDSTHVTIVGDHGSVTVTNYDAASGEITYFYTENGLRADHSGSDPVLDSFALTVTDNEGDSSSAALEINILDTAPVAEDDANVIEENATSVSGKVIAGANNGAGADTQGEDKPDVSAIRHSNVAADKATSVPDDGEVSIQGQYGTLTIAADGSYSYALDNTNATVQALKGDSAALSEVFSYTLKDLDDDTSSAALTITINGVDDDVPTIEIPDGNGPDGSDPDDPASVAGDHSVVEGSRDAFDGTMTVAADAGITTVTLEGEDITKVRAGDDSTHVAINSAHGRITVIDYDPASGKITYSYTENGLRADHSGDATVLDSFALTVTDNEGDSSSAALEISILDTAPVAEDDANAIQENATSVSGNVIAGANNGAGADTQGEDKPDVTTISSDNVSGSSASVPATGEVSIQGQYGTLTIAADGSYSYALDNTNATVQALKGDSAALNEVFSYTLKDLDDDTSSATLTITINGVDDDVPTIEIPDGNGPDGSDPDDPASVAGDHSVVEGSRDAFDGTMTVAADAGITTVTLEGEDITKVRAGDDSTHVAINSAHGRITVIDYDPASGKITYSYTENGARAHHSSDATVLDSFTLTVTDNEGDSSSAALEINILDTEPEAVADATETAEDTAKTYNVLTNDTQGVDGATLTAASVRGGDSVGTVSIDPNGEITFTPAGGFEDDAVIDYTITDGDGDESSSTLTVTVAKDSTPTLPGDDGNPNTASPTATVDEDGLAGGKAGGTDDVTGEATVTKGDLGYSFGDDGAASSNAFQWNLSGLPTDLETVDGRTVSFERSTDGHTLTGSVTDSNAEKEPVITITLTDQAAGKYEVTLHQALKHAAGDNENDLTFDAGYTVTDADGSQANGTLSVLIDDDSPVADDDSATQSADNENQPVTVNVLANDAVGADGATLTSAVEVVPQGAASKGSVSINATTGEVTFTPNDGAEGPVEIRYTLTDGDGDTSEAILSLTLADDSTPSVPSDDGDPNTASPTATVDEDGLAGGNAGGTGDVTGQATVAKGDLGYDFGDDGAATSNAFQWNLSGLPDDLETVDGRTVSFERSADGHTLTGSVTDSNDVAESVITITLTDQAAGKYEVTLHQALKHAAGDNENDLTFDAGYTVTDADGSQANGTLSVLIDDDSPVAADDSATQSADNENQPVTVNVLANDSVGADGATLTSAVEVVPQGAASKGSVSINATTGEVTFTPNDGAEGPVEIRYTLTDGDGDTSEAILSLTLADDSTPSVPSDDGDPNTASPTATVDEDGLAGGNAGGTGDVTGQATVAKGDLGYDFGDDGAATSNAFQWNLSGLPDDLETVDGRTVSFERSADGHTLTGSVTDSNDVAESVITITLTDQAAGKYEMTLHQALKHAAGDNENDLTFDAGYTVTDADGSQANGTLSVLIDDDSPVAADDSATQSADNENQPVTVNVLANDSVGADGATLTSAVEVVPQGAASKGSVSINAATGEVTFTPKAGAEGPVEIRYTLTDGDGDTSEAILSLTLADDSTPTLPGEDGNPNTASPTATVDEDGLDGGNAGGTGDVTGEATVAEGTLGYEFGDDGAATSNAFQWNLTGLPDDLETVDGRTVSFERSADGHTLTGTVTDDSGNKASVITIKLTDQAAGKYEVTLHQALKHAAGDNENDLTFDAGYTVTDADGSEANGKLSVLIDDDMPQAFEAEGLLANGMVGDVFADIVGADGVGSLVFASSIDGQEVTGIHGGKVLTSAGKGLTYQLDGDGKTLEAKTGDDEVAFEVVLAEDGSTYSVNVFDDELRAFADSDHDVDEYQRHVDYQHPTNPKFDGDKYLEFEGREGAPDVLVSAWSKNGNSASWFQHGMGSELSVGGDSLTGHNEVTRFDFVDNLEFSNSEASWDNHRGVTRFEQVVFNEKPANASLEIKVFAWADDEGNTSGHPYAESTDETIFITKENVRVYNSAGTDITANVSFTENANGTLRVFNLPDNVRFELTTDEAFEAVEIRGTDDSWAHSLGDFNYTWLDEALSLPVEGTDGDGDRANGSLELTLPSEATSAALTGFDTLEPEARVAEANLADGSQPDANELSRTGSFNLSTPNGLKELKVGTESLTLSELQALSSSTPVVLSTDYGTLTLTGYSGDVSGGTLSYEYHLDRKVDNDSQAGANDEGYADAFSVLVIDSKDGFASSVLDIEIIDDAPRDFTPDGAFLVSGEGGAVNFSTSGADGLESLGFSPAMDGAEVKGLGGGTVTTSTGETLTYHVISDGKAV